MTAQRFLFALTGLNLGLVLFLVGTRTTPALADPGIVPVLRGRALEIVDARGHVRASIAVLPADPKVKMPDGTRGYPETVVMRLSTSAGHPNVKLATTEDGSALVLGGNSNPTYVQLLARGDSTFARFSNHDGRVHVVAP